MITRRRSIRAALLALALMFAAGLPPHAHAADAAKPDDVAKFLAGMPPSADSALTPLTRDAVWQQHSRSFNAAWTGLEQRQLSRIRAWSTANLTAPQPVLLYMFSGPDFLYADAFFGGRSTYVLAGLEPVGTVPAITEASRRSLSYGLAGLRNSLGSVLNYSFFITKQMRSNFSGSTFRGTLPVLYIFLARSGKKIEDVSLITIDKDGAVVPAGADAAREPAQGVKIVFSGAEGRQQTLYYFQTDVSNGGLKRSGFVKFCEQQGKAEAFVKSASFLMHSDNFSMIRDMLLAQSQTIVEDDSGIPVRFFKPEEWQLRPYGRYLGPISLFARNYQRQLADLYRKSNPPRIDFGMGYRFRPGESNLLLATKK